MRKLTAILLCIALLGAAALTVSAAGSAHMSLSSSAGTLYRGDSFTVTVSLANDQLVSDGGIYLSYDSSVFEYVGGSCYVSNAVLTDVNATGGVFMMALGSDAVVSGTIFAFEFRVSSEAPFGNYTIGGDASLAPNGSSCGYASVTVACRHSYGSHTKLDDTNHESTCSICGEKRTDAHTWDAGTVTKAATCKDTGVKHLKCTACGAEKDETIPVSDVHKFGAWTSGGGSTHSRTCTVCGKQESGSHAWNAGEVLEYATCQKTGSRIRVCEDCGASKTETIPVTGHTYGAATSVDDKSHTHKCTGCGKEETVAHTYSEAWESDANWHFQSCDDCGFKKDLAAHVPGPAATETTDQICTVCHYVLQPMGAHEHDYAKEWSFDETGHWYACSGCNEKNSAAPHVYDSGCDADCNLCGMKREPLHDLEESWSADETGHWHICKACGEKVGALPHTPGAEATITTAQLCTDCGFEIAPVLPHDHVYNADGSRHKHVCACGATYEADATNCEICLEENKPFPWSIVCIAEAVLFGGVIAFLLLKGKKRLEPAETV